MSEEECLEEQLLELETLESLYPESFRRVSDSGRVKFTLDLLPHPDSDEPSHVCVRMHVELPVLYPLGGGVPIVKVTSIKGLSQHSVTELESVVHSELHAGDGECAEMLAEGMSVMFSLASVVTEFLVNNNIPSDTSLLDKSKAETALRERLRKMKGAAILEEEKQRADAHSMTSFDKEAYRRRLGTPCTNETFDAWFVGFEAWFHREEIAERKEADSKVTTQKGDSMTGKEIFQEISEREMKENLAKMQKGMAESAPEEDVSEEDEDADVSDSFDTEETTELMSAASAVETGVDLVTDSRKKKKRRKKKSGKKSSAVVLEPVTVVTDESLFLDADLDDL